MEVCSSVLNRQSISTPRLTQWLHDIMSLITFLGKALGYNWRWLCGA